MDTNTIRHRRRRNKRYDIANTWKRGGCIQCGESRYPALDFHHRNPEDKSFPIAAALAASVPMDMIEREVKEKCDVLCKNCHAVLHAQTKNLEGLDGLDKGV